VRRFAVLLFPALHWGIAPGQSPVPDSTALLGFSRSLSVPLNAARLFDRALEAWTWTFGKEPGARLVRSDREAGVIEGVARLNFRSEMLTLREESMGTVAYRVTVQVRAGECRTLVSELVHTGNRSAARGGVSLGLLTRGELPRAKVPGMGRGNTQRLHAELKAVADERVTGLVRAFEARIRAGSEP